MTTLAQIVDGAKFRADLANTDRVSDAEWGALANEAVLHAWRLAAGARPDFQIAFQDFTVVSGGSASFAVPSNFFGLIDVVFAPDTTSEYSLGPFAWQNRRSPGGWLQIGAPSVVATGGTAARLMGGAVYIEPASRAGGTYRLWYCPAPTTLAVPDFTVRAVQIGALPGILASTGAGVGHTITSLSPGTPFLPDGVPTSVGDRVLLKNQTTDNGIYVMTAIDPFAMVRATDLDSANEFVIGKTIFVTEGATLAQSYWSISAFTIGLDTTSGGPVITATAPAPSNILDPILDPFLQLIKIRAAIPAVIRDDRLPNDLRAEAAPLEAELQAYFRSVRNSNGPQKIIDTDARGPRGWGSW